LASYPSVLVTGISAAVVAAAAAAAVGHAAFVDLRR
jgi:hypothetical protein